MKKILPFVSLLLLAGACMKSKNEYRQAIEEVQQEQYNEARQEQEQRQEQEENRARGSNDREGMGMDE